MSAEKKINFVQMWFQRFKSTWELWMTPIQRISIKKVRYFMMTCFSNLVLLYEILKAEVCWCWLWSLSALPVFCSSSAALRPCQARSKHTATCVSGQRFPQNSYSPCSTYLQQWWLLKIQGAAWTSLIYLLACLVLCVTLERSHWCTHVDTGTRALICDTSQWTNRDEGFHAGKLSHAL